ncbi:hypothetical protein [Moraxella bovis]|uniref:hypothetical protein n=1 Tax=Moraxella bovis TaxID=476 RepID=UPI0022260478|nr:hypothetical protein [Moraxella bovis]UZA27102.1 hypothetical protein LP119_11055 [Moraxella bovis]
MSDIRFVKNNQPFLDDNLISFFDKHPESFNLGEKPEGFRESSVPNFFDVTDEFGNQIGIAFFTVDDEHNKEIEISLGKINDKYQGFADKVLSKLDKIKLLLPSKWFDENGDEYKTHWLAIVKDSNPACEHLRRVNKKHGFIEEKDQSNYIFKKPI